MIHGCFSGIAAWFVRGLTGLHPDRASPGFKHFFLKPGIVGDLTWAKAYLDSVHGRIVCDWAVKSGRLSMKIDVPVNTTATVYVPANDASAITEGGKPAAETAGLKFVRMEGGGAVFDVQPGHYEFLATPSTP
jgi:alpha-L-rhamnosidase